jgi:hypothetical protein
MVGYWVMDKNPAQAQSQRVFEMRTYTATPGNFDKLKTRFRDHTLRLFAKHGMTNVGYWIPQDEPRHSNTLVYILAYPSKEAATASWKAFRADPEWQAAAKASEVNGRIVEKVESVFLDPADFSPMK